MGRRQTANLVFFAFDILWRGQDDLRAFSLADRKEILATVLTPVAGGRVVAAGSRKVHEEVLRVLTA